MAETDKEKVKVEAAYPLPVYNYQVKIGGSEVAFSEVSGLDIVFETTTYKESGTDTTGVKTFHMPGQGTPAHVTLKKGVVKHESHKKQLYDWISATKVHIANKKDVEVDLLDENGKAVFTWKIRNAFPIKMGVFRRICG